MTLSQRIFREHRASIVTLAAVLAINLGVYLLVVRPLGEKSAGAANRAASAAAGLKAAERELSAAQGLVSGEKQAETALTTFYDKVLPSNQSAARRMTFASLPELAAKTNVRYQASRYDTEEIKKNQRVGRLRIQMILEGEWSNVRRFIYQLETDPSFIIIDDVTLTQGDPGKPLALTLELSAYYRVGANGN